MAAFLVVSVRVRSLDWVAKYTAKVPTIVRSHGGRFVAVSMSSPDAVETLEGTSLPPDGFAIITFSTVDAIKAFLADPDYAPYRQARQAGTVSEAWSFENDDAAPQFIGQ